MEEDERSNKRESIRERGPSPSRQTSPNVRPCFFCRISGLNPILQPENGKADIQRKITWIDMDSREAQDSHV